MALTTADYERLDDVARELERLAALGLSTLTAAERYDRRFIVHVQGRRWVIDPLSWPLCLSGQVDDEGLLFTWARERIAALGIRLTFTESPEDGVEVTLRPPGGLARGRIRRTGTCGLLVLLSALREALTPIPPPAPPVGRAGGLARQQR